MLATIAVSIGDSGRNDEYLYKLDTFLSEAINESPAAAEAFRDHSGDTDTQDLAYITRLFQKYNDLYFLFGSGSNQHNQLLLQSDSNAACLINGDEAHDLKDILLVVPKSRDGPLTESKAHLSLRPKELYAGGGNSALLTEKVVSLGK